LTRILAAIHNALIWRAFPNLGYYDPQTRVKGITTRLDDTNAWLRGLTAIAGGAAGAIVIALVTGAIAVARLGGKMESRLEGFDKQMERFDTQITRLEDAIRGLDQSRPG
jgi:hypothetical protein